MRTLQLTESGWTMATVAGLLATNGHTNFSLEVKPYILKAFSFQRIEVCFLGEINNQFQGFTTHSFK
jgi:hypothetical protein